MNTSSKSWMLRRRADEIVGGYAHLSLAQFYDQEEKRMKKFILIWLGELVSSIGSGMTAFALSVYVYQTT